MCSTKAKGRDRARASERVYDVASTVDQAEHSHEVYAGSNREKKRGERAGASRDRTMTTILVVRCCDDNRVRSLECEK